MSESWLPGAERDTRWTCNTMSRNTGSVRVVLHSTENRVGTDPWDVANYMIGTAGNSSGYHLLVPLESTHRPLQLRPAECAAGSLRNSNETKVSPNKQGTLLVAVSLVAYAADGHAASGDLGPWWPDVCEWLRGWGVPQRWIGPVPQGGGRTSPMSLELWYSDTPGWVSHATVPAECNRSTHWDPGKVDPAQLWPTIEEEDMEIIWFLPNGVGGILIGNRFVGIGGATAAGLRAAGWTDVTVDQATHDSWKAAGVL